MCMFCDSHCHLYKEYYEDLDLVINESIENHISYFIVDGCDRDSNKEVLELTNKFDNLYVTLGIHPENVDNYNKDDLLFIEKHLNAHKVIAIGEIGLDYHYSKENKEAQKELLISQLKLAKKYHKPVVIHSREATEDTIEILKMFPEVKGVIHSFSGSVETARIYIKMGYKLGINGVVTFKNSHLKDIIPEIKDHIILETDSPYLTPHPYRGTTNSPKYILLIAEFICSILDIPLEELSTLTNSNIKEIFGINI